VVFYYEINENVWCLSMKAGQVTDILQLK